MSEQTKPAHIAFIGCGNMGASLIGGLVTSGYPASCITAADPDPEKRTVIVNRHGIAAYDDNTTAIRGASAVVLAVKPQLLKATLKPMMTALRTSGSVIISVAAGIRTEAIDRWLGSRGTAVVRAMPNTPALVGAGATGLFANAGVTTPQRQLADTIMQSVGVTLWLKDEELLDAVTAVSGSGPAYFFLFMEALEQAGIDLGLPPEQARQLALQTAYGAAHMARESDVDAATLRERVTSPGGTTEQAINCLQAGGLADLIKQAATAARDRSRELSDTFGAD